MLFSGHSEASEQMNPQKLRQGTQNMCKLKLDKIPAETGRCGHEIPTLTKELLSTDSGWVGGDQFSLRIWSLGSTILQWILTHPRIYRQHKLESIGYKTTTTVLKEYEKI